MMQRGHRWLRAIVSMAPAFALAPQAVHALAAPPNADSLLIVDCLLPGQVRRLGTQATYVTARRAMKTSAADCAIRGGEYTATDRASYATSMRVWLPLAKAGDPEAQTNVGEILEKGIGGAPQPDLAVQWYALAAEQGASRAQLNLGSMYERGLGVPLDRAKAVEWYRKASGLASVNLPYVPAEDITALRRERDELSRQLEAERAERTRLQQELDAVRGRLEGDRSALQRSRDDLEAARRALAARTQTERTGEPELAALRRDVERRDLDLRRLHASVAELESRAAALQGQLQSADARRVADVTAAQAEARAARVALSRLTERLGSAQAQLDRAQGRTDVQAGEVARLRQELGEVKAGAAARAGIEARLSAREAELAETRAQVEALEAEKARLEREADALRRSAAQAGPARAASAAPAPSPALPSDFSFGRYHALVIGNNAYGRLQKLETAVHDARAVEEVLRTRYGFKTTLLLNADRYQLLSALNKLREELTDKDNLLIYYAGHGELDRVNNRGYWLPVDAEPNSSANWISSIQVTDVLNAMSAKQVLLVADSCYSGVLTRTSIASLDAGMSQVERLRWLQAMATKKARVVLTSGGVQPVLDGGGGEHSVFAAAFLEALRANTGVLESAKLAQGVIRKVTVSDAAGSIGQVPVYAPIRFAGHEAGDFFFVAKN